MQYLHVCQCEFVQIVSECLYNRVHNLYVFVQIEHDDSCEPQKKLEMYNKMYKMTEYVQEMYKQKCNFVHTKTFSCQHFMP